MTADDVLAGRWPALQSWLAAETGSAGDWSARRLGGGNSNLTFLLQGPAGRLVLRCPPVAGIAPSAHNITREHRILAALARTTVPVPRPLALCTDPDVIGVPFMVMEHVPGMAITDRLPPAYSGPASLRAIGTAMVDALAEVHLVDWRAARLDDFGKPAGFLERQVPRWRKQYDSYAVRPLPRFEEVAQWLEDNLPSAQPPAILHGDFHLDNCLYDEHEPRLLAILDWEMATTGDPLLDLGLALAFWGREPSRPLAMAHIQGVSLHPAAPTREELAQRYAARTGRRVDALPYYLTLAFWKLAAIVEGAYALHVHGRLDSPYAAALEHDVPRLLDEAADYAGLA